MKYAIKATLGSRYWNSEENDWGSILLCSRYETKEALFNAVDQARKGGNLLGPVEIAEIY